MKPVKLSNHLLSDLRALIADARQDVARRVNSALVILYWKVGKRVRQDILKEKRAGYGEEIVSTLSRQLVEEFGNKLTPDLVFRDPYFLNFLGLKDTFSEKDMEAAILRELEGFILELGVGFTFVARQKRITMARVQKTNLKIGDHNV